MIDLNWADWTLIGVIVISCLISLKRGFAKEAMSLAIWIVAFIVARRFHANFQSLLENSIDSPELRIIAAFSILFVATLLLGAAINAVLGALIRLTGLSPLDRMLGIVFGFARGAILAVVLIAIARLTPLTENPWWQESVVIEHLAVVEQWSRSVFEAGKQSVMSFGNPLT